MIMIKDCLGDEYTPKQYASRGLGTGPLSYGGQLEDLSEMVERLHRSYTDLLTFLLENNRITVTEFKNLVDGK